jgi:hypothetical protein
MAHPTLQSKLTRLFGVTWPEDYDSPLWTLRLSPVVAFLSVALAETVWKAGFWHGICIGIALGQLAVICLAALQIKGITFRNPPADAGPQQLHLTR